MVNLTVGILTELAHTLADGGELVLEGYDLRMVRVGDEIHLQDCRDGTGWRTLKTMRRRVEVDGG